jgi:hypothetical protein
MAGHLSITKSLGAAVYFCDSHSPWQRGSNENINACSGTISPRAPTSAPTRPSTSYKLERDQQPSPPGA